MRTIYMNTVTDISADEVELAAIGDALQYHREIDGEYPRPNLLSYVCTECGSIGVSATPEARDINVANIDLTCHLGYTFTVSQV